MLVSVSSTVPGLQQGLSELVAVNAAGLIVGSTSNACRLTGVERPADLHGRPFETVFDADAASLDRFPDRPLNALAGDHAIVHLAAHAPRPRNFAVAERPLPPTADPGRPSHGSSGPTLQELIVGSSEMGLMCNRAESLFENALPFLIEGETGTGKTALIAALHSRAGFASGEISTVDCAVLSENNNDREYIRMLIGQARISSVLGRVDNQIATLVFDNIDEMPMYAQAELRNFLDEAEASLGIFGRAKSSRGLRVLATSQRPLTQKVESGEFREDLYYLLANNRVALPPVRQRDDRNRLIALLATQIAPSKVKVSNEAMASLCAHNWPGNVRQLRNTLQQAILAGSGETVLLDDLPESGVISTSALPHSSADEAPRLDAMSDHAERTELLRALISARWNVSRAANNIGIGRATIHRRMKRYSISRPN